MAASKYEVVVGNIGTVYSGTGTNLVKQGCTVPIVMKPCDAEEEEEEGGALQFCEECNSHYYGENCPCEEEEEEESEP